MIEISEQLLRDMLRSGVHFGHRPTKWNPKMAPYIYGRHSGVHVFDLNKTAVALQKAAEFLSQQRKEGKTILFVGTKQQAARAVDEAAQYCGMPHITHKWVPGLLTNFGTIKKRIKYLKDLKVQKEAGDFDKYTKKEALELERTIKKLQEALGGVQEMEKKPDALIVADIVRDPIAVKEAKKLGIPIIAIVDSNADPTGITHPIPGNDDAVQSIQFLIGVLRDALGKKKEKSAEPIKA